MKIISLGRGEDASNSKQTEYDLCKVNPPQCCFSSFHLINTNSEVCQAKTDKDIRIQIRMNFNWKIERKHCVFSYANIFGRRRHYFHSEYIKYVFPFPVIRTYFHSTKKHYKFHFLCCKIQRTSPLFNIRFNRKFCLRISLFPCRFLSYFVWMWKVLHARCFPPQSFAQRIYFIEFSFLNGNYCPSESVALSGLYIYIYIVYVPVLLIVIALSYLFWAHCCDWFQLFSAVFLAQFVSFVQLSSYLIYFRCSVCYKFYYYLLVTVIIYYL